MLFLFEALLQLIWILIEGTIGICLALLYEAFMALFEIAVAYPIIFILIIILFLRWIVQEILFKVRLRRAQKILDEMHDSIFKDKR